MKTIFYKTKRVFVLGIVSVFIFSAGFLNYQPVDIYAQASDPYSLRNNYGNGSDGDCIFTSNITLDTSREYNCTSLTVANGVTVTATGNNPLIFRVSGNVNIEGVIDVSGTDGGDAVDVQGCQEQAGGAAGIGSAGGGNGGAGGSFLGLCTTYNNILGKANNITGASNGTPGRGLSDSYGRIGDLPYCHETDSPPGSGGGANKTDGEDGKIGYNGWHEFWGGEYLSAGLGGTGDANVGALDLNAGGGGAGGQAQAEDESAHCQSAPEAGGYPGAGGAGGGAGGGAIAITSSGAVTILGSILADGGNGGGGVVWTTNSEFNSSGGGAGGSVVILAGMLINSGTVSAAGGLGGSVGSLAGDAGLGGDGWVLLSSDQDLTECFDGVDNDGDGLFDDQDPGCHTDGDPTNPDSYDPFDDDEADGVEDLINPSLDECEDGIDNDGDGYIDIEDPDCHTDGNADNADSYDSARSEGSSNAGVVSTITRTLSAPTTGVGLLVIFISVLIGGFGGFGYYAYKKGWLKSFMKKKK